MTPEERAADVVRDYWPDHAPSAGDLANRIEDAIRAAEADAREQGRREMYDRWQKAVGMTLESAEILAEDVRADMKAGHGAAICSRESSNPDAPPSVGGAR